MYFISFCRTYLSDFCVVVFLLACLLLTVFYCNLCRCCRVCFYMGVFIVADVIVFRAVGVAFNGNPAVILYAQPKVFISVFLSRKHILSVIF